METPERQICREICTIQMRILFLRQMGRHDFP